MSDSLNYCLPGSSVHGILQARILEWVAISFSRVSSQRRDRTPGLPHCGQTLPSESPGKPYWSTSPNKSLWLEEMSHSLTQRLLENPTYSNSLLCNFCVFHVKLEPQCVCVCVCGAKLTTTKSSSPSPRSWKSPTLPECNHNHHTFNFRLDETLYCCHFFISLIQAPLASLQAWVLSSSKHSLCWHTVSYTLGRNSGYSKNLSHYPSFCL